MQSFLRGRPTPAGYWLAILLTAAATACGGDDLNSCPDGLAVLIEGPADGVTVSPANDVDADTDGIQVDVEVQTQGFTAGDSLTLEVTDGDSTSLGSATASIGADGSALFNNVTVAAGAITLSVTADLCSDRVVGDSVVINVISDQTCSLAIAEGPIDVGGDLRVLNSTIDDDSLPNFQATVEVTTIPGFTVEVLVLDTGSGDETSAGTGEADGDGVASVSTSLNEGIQAVRATCTAPDGLVLNAPSEAFLVDITPPECQLLEPGNFITPADDTDGDTPGVQAPLRGSCLGNDTEGSPASFLVGAEVVDASAVDQTGQSAATTTFGSPGTQMVSFSCEDAAANTCTTDARAVVVELEGCSIEHVAPTGVVTIDTNPAVDGIQTELQLAIGTECAGQEVTTTCDINGATFTVPNDGALAEEITVCGTNPCMLQFDCQSEVQSPAGNVTFAAATIEVDNQAPILVVDVFDPGETECGDGVTPDIDIDAGTAGVQIELLAGPFNPGLTVEQTAGGTTTTITPTSGFVVVTLEEDLNRFQAILTDVAGNRGESDFCDITLRDVAVDIDFPADGAVLSAADGTEDAGDLLVDITGTVGPAGATVSVNVNGTDFAVVPVAGAWTLTDARLVEGANTITATGQNGIVTVTETVNVTVDLTAPAAPTNPVAAVVDRQSATFSWTAPDDGGAVAAYVIRVADEPLNDGNFGTTGIELTAPTPDTPGTTQEITAISLPTENQVFFGIVALDAAGNRSPVTAATAVTPVFESSGTFNAIPDVTSDIQAFGGSAMASGDLNGDGIADLIISGPTADLGLGAVDDDNDDGVVYVYLGKDGGIDTTPEIRLTATEPDGLFGRDLAVLDWNGDGTQDLAVGAPFQNGFGGRVLIFLGGSDFADQGATTDISQDDAAVDIRADNAGGFALSTLGFGLSAGRFDDDNRDDLVIGAPFGFAQQGSALVVYGGVTTASDIIMSESAGGRAGGATVARLAPPATAGDPQFGTLLTGVGRVDGPADTRDDFLLQPAFTEDADTVVLFRGRANKPATDYEVFNVLASDLVLTTTTGGSNSFGLSAGSVETSAGVRSLVVAEPGVGTGRVFVLPGTTSGNQVAQTVATTIVSGVGGVTSTGVSVANGAGALAADVDNDNREDLLFTAVNAGAAELYGWFGDDIPAGSTDVNSASFVRAIASPQGSTDVLIWAGDLNDDGLDDLAAGDTRGDIDPGAVEVLY